MTPDFLALTIVGSICVMLAFLGGWYWRIYTVMCEEDMVMPTRDYFYWRRAECEAYHSPGDCDYCGAAP